jgi:sugar fermentation stimulation protein A
MKSSIIYTYDVPLLRAVLLKRYKRFLGDVVMESTATPSTIYCPNTGSMLGLIPPGVESPQCMVSLSTGSARKYPHTLEMILINREW